MRREQPTQFQGAIAAGSDVAGRSSILSRTIPAAWLVAALAGYFGLSQLLLWRFLDVAPGWLYLVSALLLGGLCVGVARAFRSMPLANGSAAPGPSVATLSFCIAVSLLLFLLGGEGRLLYANIDWAVRDAVLHDLAVNPWPFVYTARAEPDVLRAPLGMFFIPALASKALGARAGDWALLIQNAALLGTLLALASMLFGRVRDRFIALAVFLAFSGLDVLGQALTGRWHEHMEGWAGPQFSSTITLAFWVPQHAIAGWVGAVAFLLWRAGRAPLTMLLALLPLTALWSPLSLMGSLPFAAVAGIISLRRREFRPRDILLPLASCALTLPALLYLGSASDGVGIRIFSIGLLDYLFFQLFEILIYLVPVLLVAARLRTDVTVATVAICLLCAPIIQIGGSADFGMRASIPASAILAVLVAQILQQPTGMGLGRMKLWLLAMLAIGAITWKSELARAFAHPPLPLSACSLFKAAEEGFGGPPTATYLAPLDEMHPLVRPLSPTRVGAAEPRRCWPNGWYRPSGV